MVGSLVRNARAISVVVRPADKAQGQRGACLGGQQRVAGHEDEPQQVIAEPLIGRAFDAPAAELLLHLKLVPDQCVLALAHLGATQLIDGAVAGGRHEPGGRVVGDTAPGPLLERAHQGVLCQLFRQSHVAQPPCQGCDQPRGLDAPDRIDRPVDIRERHAHG